MQNTNIKTDIKIIQASPADLDAVTAVEAVCFPAAEAAGRQSFAHRLAAFPESFFLAVHDGQIIGFINGCVTNETTIRDEMYEDSSLHDPRAHIRAFSAWTCCRNTETAALPPCSWSI